MGASDSKTEEKGLSLVLPSPSSSLSSSSSTIVAKAINEDLGKITLEEEKSDGGGIAVEGTATEWEEEKSDSGGIALDSTATGWEEFPSFEATGWEEIPSPLEGTGWEEIPSSLEKASTPSHLGKNKRPWYPRRPGEPDCFFYLKAGSCRYGSNCKFNHPIRGKRNEKVVNEKQNETLSKRVEQKNCKDAKEKQKTPSELVGKTGDKAVKVKQDKTLSKRMDPTDQKAVEERETPSERDEQTEFRAAMEKENKTQSEKVGKPEGKKIVNEKQMEALSKRTEQKTCKKEVKEKQEATSETGEKTGYKKANKEKETPSEREGQTNFKNNSMPGGSKLGKACKYDHLKEKSKVIPVELNFLGLPMRPGERTCSYYLRTGGCKFATNCRYHHPDPTAVVGQDNLSGYQNGGSPQQHPSGASAVPPMTSWPLHGNSNVPVPFFSSGFSPLPPQGFYPNPEWNGYQAPVMPWLPPELNTGNSSAPAMKDASETVFDEYPERPGQRECHYFMKNGECNYKSACRFHHPRNHIQKDPPGLSPSSEPASKT